MILPTVSPAVSSEILDTLLVGVKPATLWRIFSNVIMRRDMKVDKIHADYGTVPKERYTVEEKIIYIRQKLAANGRLRFSILMDACTEREEKVATFLALLEMIRRNLVTFSQADTFADIELEVSCARTTLGT